MRSRHRQRGYAVIPYLASLVGSLGTASAATTAAAAVGTAAAAAGTGYLASKALTPKAPGLQPGGAPPTIDQAKQTQQTTDRLRIRRGVLSNLYSPSGGSAPSVGTKSLLGQ